MKRSELHVGDKVALVTSSYGSTSIREVVVLSVERWEKSHSYYSRTTTVTYEGQEYGVRGYKRVHPSSNVGANGVLVGYGSEGIVAQLKQLEPLAQALAEEAARNEAARADFARRKAEQEAWEQRLVKVLDALGIQRGDVDRVYSTAHIPIEELEALAARVTVVPF